MLNPKNQRILMYLAIIYLIVSVVGGHADPRQWDFSTENTGVASTGSGAFDFSLGVTNISDGTLNDAVEESQIITITSSDLNSTLNTNITFDLDFAQTEGTYDTTKPFVVEVTGTCYQGSNVVDTSDTTLYRTCVHSTTSWYDITVGGVNFNKAGAKATQTVSYSEITDISLRLQIEDSASLDKLAKNTYDEVVVAKFTLSNGKNVIVKYVKTA